MRPPMDDVQSFFLLVSFDFWTKRNTNRVSAAWTNAFFLGTEEEEETLTDSRLQSARYGPKARLIIVIATRALATINRDKCIFILHFVFIFGWLAAWCA